MEKFIYAFETPNNKLNIYKVITFIILSLNVFGFGFVFLKTFGSISVLSIILLILNAVPWGYYLLNKTHINFKIVTLTFIISAFMWLYLDNYVMCIALIVFSILGQVANKKLIVSFFEKGFVYPSFPSKNIEWNEISNVIFKDDILTIDLENNKLIQLNIENKWPTNFDENEFNDWCTNFLKQIKTK